MALILADSRVIVSNHFEGENSQRIFTHELVIPDNGLR